MQIEFKGIVCENKQEAIDFASVYGVAAQLIDNRFVAIAEDVADELLAAGAIAATFRHCEQAGRIVSVPA